MTASPSWKNFRSGMICKESVPLVPPVAWLRLICEGVVANLFFAIFCSCVLLTSQPERRTNCGSSVDPSSSSFEYSWSTDPVLLVVRSVLKDSPW